MMRFEIIAIYDMVIFHLPALHRSVLKEKFVFYAKNDSVGLLYRCSPYGGSFITMS